MSRFHDLKVSKIIHQTPDAVSIAFELPEDLKETMQYLPGQYLTLNVPVNGNMVRRCYSVCSSPFGDEPMQVAVKRVPAGLVSNYLNDKLQEGDVLQVMPPLGNFHSPLHADNQKHYLLFAGGSGITPILSIIKSVLLVEPKSTMTLFYGNRDRESVIFNEDIQNLESANQGRLKVVHILQNGNGSYSGLMDKAMVLKLLREQTNLNFQHTEAFICGPEAMMREVQAALQIMMLPVERVHVEYFTFKEGEGESETVGADDLAELKDGEQTKVTITYDGSTYELEMSSQGTVLEAALDAGYDPPYSCMVAACCTCRAKLVSGKVEMEDRESLTDEEIAEGYVLTCQSHPKSHGVVLSYDD